MENQTIVIAVIVGIAFAVLATAFLIGRARRREKSAALREHFGPEYDRLVTEYGDQEKAEQELRAREKRVHKFPIRLLSVEQGERYGLQWDEVQRRFVDGPSAAVIDADDLVKEVMRERGYPVGDFDQRIADLSVEHGTVVDHYRAARTLAIHNANGQANTEDLRQAMVHYRVLFSALLKTQEPAPKFRTSFA